LLLPLHIQKRKVFQLQGNFEPWSSDQKLCPWTLLHLFDAHDNRIKWTFGSAHTKKLLPPCALALVPVPPATDSSAAHARQPIGLALFAHRRNPESDGESTMSKKKSSWRMTRIYDFWIPKHRQLVPPTSSWSNSECRPTSFIHASCSCLFYRLFTLWNFWLMLARPWYDSRYITFKTELAFLS